MWSILTPSSSSALAFGKGNSAGGAPSEKDEERERSDLEEGRGDVETKDEDRNFVNAALDDNGNKRVQSSTFRSLPRHTVSTHHSRNLPTIDPSSEAPSTIKSASPLDCGGATHPLPGSPRQPSPSPPTLQPLTPPSSPGTRRISVQGSYKIWLKWLYGGTWRSDVNWSKK